MAISNSNLVKSVYQKETMVEVVPHELSNRDEDIKQFKYNLAKAQKQTKKYVDKIRMQVCSVVSGSFSN
jgi:hypothetical protein